MGCCPKTKGRYKQGPAVQDCVRCEKNTFFSAKRIFVYFRNSSGAILMPEGKFREGGFLI
jgi:hypothetical protein